VTETASAWVNDDSRGELAEAIDHGYELMNQLRVESCAAHATSDAKDATRH
jgi:hypothetical protein